MKTEEEILDRIVEILDNNLDFTDKIKGEWLQLNKEYNNLQEEYNYSSRLWYKGYDICFYGNKILTAKCTEENYKKMFADLLSKIGKN